MDDFFDVSDSLPAASVPTPQKSPKVAPVQWKDPRFQPAIDAVRSACGFNSSDREDDPMIGMCVAATHRARFIII